MKNPVRFVVQLALVLVLTACAGKVHRPCTDAGEPARDKPFRGTKQCYQAKNKYGEFVNNGLYYEWFPSGKKALEGEYQMGRKTGKWIEWDESGKKISERYYQDGIEVSSPK